MRQELGRGIRVAMVTGDAELLAKAINEPGIDKHLQAAGEAALALREERAGGIDETYPDIAETLAMKLEAREWPGDRELAALLRDQPRTDVQRRRIRADLDQVADLLEGSLYMGFGGVLDMQTGVAWPESALDDWPDDDEPRPDPDNDPDRYLFIPNESSRDAWHDMHDFAAAQPEERVREQLLDAIDGKGAFSRFKRALDRHDGLGADWNTHSTEARSGRARAWLFDAGFDVLPPPK